MLAVASSGCDEWISAEAMVGPADTISTGTGGGP